MTDTVPSGGSGDSFQLCVGTRAVIAGGVVDRAILDDVVRQLDDTLDGLTHETLTPEERVGAMAASLVEMARRCRPRKGMTRNAEMGEIMARAVYLLAHDETFRAKNPKGVIVVCDPLDAAEAGALRVVGYATDEEFDATVEAMREAGDLFGSQRTLRDYH